MPFLATIGSLAFKAIGGHLVSSNPVSKLEGAVSGLGLRFLGGLGTGFYLLNSDFRAGMDQCIGAVLDQIKSVF